MQHDFMSIDGKYALTVELDPLWIGGEIYLGCQRCDNCRRVCSMRQLRADDDGSLFCKDCN